MIVVVLAAVAATPQVELSWRGADGQLAVTAPSGRHLAEDAPADVSLTWEGNTVSWSVPSSAELGSGMRFGPVRPGPVTGAVRVAVCEDGGTLCQVEELWLDAVVSERRRGVAEAVVVAGVWPRTSAEGHGGGHHAATWGGGDSAAVAEQGMKVAAEHDRLVLLDFAAVWCPPCNLMAAEVLEALPAPQVLEGFEVVRVDVDDASSWTLKDRYEVGGYPTAVVVRPDGTEVARAVGYSGKVAFEDWLAGIGAATVEPADPSVASPAEAARVAWRLVREDRGDPGPWIARGAAAPEVVELRLARVVTTPTLDDARWLADHAPGHALDWVPSALEAVGATPEGAAALAHALLVDLRTQTGVAASDLLALTAELEPEEERPLLYAAAAATLRSSLTGRIEADRGHLTWLASLLERSGDVEAGLWELRRGATAWPDDPTFHLALAGTLERAERLEEARVQAERALATSWGDNRLRAAAKLADVLAALGRSDDARALASRVLAEIPAPAEGVKVRTHKYRAKLEERARAEVVATGEE